MRFKQDSGYQTIHVYFCLGGYFRTGIEETDNEKARLLTELLERYDAEEEKKEMTAAAAKKKQADDAGLAKEMRDASLLT